MFFSVFRYLKLVVDDWLIVRLGDRPLSRIRPEIVGFLEMLRCRASGQAFAELGKRSDFEIGQGIDFELGQRLGFC